MNAEIAFALMTRYGLTYAEIERIPPLVATFLLALGAES